MPLPDDQNPTHRARYWQAIARILLLQVLVLLALSGAVVFYLSWSSDANWAEFAGASRLKALAQRPHPPTDSPVRR